MRVSTAYRTACTIHQVLKFPVAFPSPQIQLTQLKSNQADSDSDDSTAPTVMVVDSSSDDEGPWEVCACGMRALGGAVGVVNCGMAHTQGHRPCGPVGHPAVNSSIQPEQVCTPHVQSSTEVNIQDLPLLSVP